MLLLNFNLVLVRAVRGGAGALTPLMNVSATSAPTTSGTMVRNALHCTLLPKRANLKHSWHSCPLNHSDPLHIRTVHVDVDMEGRP
jgi:hypothetical protein